MVKVAIGLLALALSSTAQAQNYPISYAEQMEAGSDIDIAQGTYLCIQDNPTGVMNKLINIRSAKIRRDQAYTMGCRFILADDERSFRVKRVVASVCLDRVVSRGGILLPNGRPYEGPIVTCGREGHELVIDRGDDVEQRVIVLSLDIDNG